MKKLLFSVFFSLMSLISQSQSWQPVGPNSFNSVIIGLGEFNNKLYVGGGFTSPATYFTDWNNSTWNSNSSGYQYLGSQTGICAFVNYDSVLYATGLFDTINKLSCNDIAQWNGVTWDTVGLDFMNDKYEVGYSLLLNNRKLYLGGGFSDTLKNKKILNCIAVWDGKSWDSLGHGMLGSVYTLANYNGKIYAGGQFDVASDEHIQGLASWDGTKWDSVYGGAGVNGAAYAMVIYNNKLYVAGEFNNVGGVPGTIVNNIAVWDGTKWDSLSHGITGDNGNAQVRSLTVYQGELVVGGMFDSAGGQPASNIAAWDGTNWHAIGSGLQGGNYEVLSLLVMDSTLYVAGDFNASGSTSLNDIAMWQGPLGINEVNGKNVYVDVYPSPANSNLNIQVSLENGQTDNICLYDNMGREIMCQILNTNLTTLNISQLSSGIYYYRITNMMGDLIKSDKLLIAR